MQEIARLSEREYVDEYVPARAYAGFVLRRILARWTMIVI